MNRTQLSAVGGIAIASMVPAAPLCYMLASLLPLFPEASYWLPHWLFCSDDAVEHVDTIPQTSATILGLANFGFLLGVRLNKPQMRIQYDSLAVAFSAIVIVTFLQMSLIVQVHGGTLYLPFYYYAMYVTTAALFFVGFCFVRILYAGSHVEKKHFGYEDDIKDDVGGSHDSDDLG